MVGGGRKKREKLKRREAQTPGCSGKRKKGGEKSAQGWVFLNDLTEEKGNVEHHQTDNHFHGGKEGAEGARSDEVKKKEP